jgi:protein dithiol oxidoreductase (disulfide-forming)
VAEAPAAEKTLGLTEETEGATEPIAGRSVIAAAIASNIPAPPAPDPGRWVEGKHYVKLVTAEPTHVAPGRIEVLEEFWYGCAHCFHLDPTLEAWRKKGKAPYVDFARTHVMWNPTTLAHAKLFYTIKALDKLEELHALVFREIHVNGNFLAAADPDTTEKLQRAFLKDHGVPEATFATAYHSFSVDNDLRQAEDTTRRYRVTGVPFLIVNGKYTTDVAQAGGEDELIALLDYLAAAEHKR